MKVDGETPETQHWAKDKSAHKRVMEHRRMIVAEMMAQQLGRGEIVKRLEAEHEISVNPQTVSNDFVVIREQWRRHCAESYGEHVAERANTLNVLERECMAIVMSSLDDDKRLRAIGRELEITDRIMRLLGLEPTTTTRSITARMTPDGHGGQTLEVEASLTENDATRMDRIAGILADAGALPADAGVGFSDAPPQEFLDIIEAAGGPAGELGDGDDAAVDELHPAPPD